MVNASEALGGRAALAGVEVVAFLRLNDGSRICQKSFDEREFTAVPPAFDPTSGAVYGRGPGNRLQGVRHLPGGVVLSGGRRRRRVRHANTRVFGAGGSTVFALDL